MSQKYVDHAARAAAKRIESLINFCARARALTTHPHEESLALDLGVSGKIRPVDLILLAEGSTGFAHMIDKNQATVIGPFPIVCDAVELHHRLSDRLTAR
ncbi:MAG: hypothetical protein ACXWNK_05280 [Vulcanimicrobiaceae bacterium]